MIVIVNYGLGNLTSILNMCKRLGIDAMISSETEALRNASKIILPGVGHFKHGMEQLISSGLKDVLDEQVMQVGKPILGICLGAQLMTQHSEEGNVEGLCWVDAVTVKFDMHAHSQLKVPHMGWSDVRFVDEHAIWKDLPDAPRFYHVHSYHFNMLDEQYKSAITQYGYEFVCAFRKNNVYGVQFHPEKSHKYGMKLLQNFNEL